MQFLGLGQIEAGDAKAPRGHLLDGAVFGVALFIGPGVAIGVFAAFASIGLAADAVHGDRQRLVGFLGNRPIAHGSGLKPPGDGLHGLHFVEGNRLARLKLQQITQAEELFVLLVDQSGVLLIGLVIAGSDRLLQGVDDLGTEQVSFALLAPLVVAADIEGDRGTGAIGKGVTVALEGFFGQYV